MFFDGYIGAPPTITVFSFDISLFIILSLAIAGAMAVAVRVRAPRAATDRNAIRLDMERLPIDMTDNLSPVRLSSNNDPLIARGGGSVAVGGGTGGFRSRFQEIFFAAPETFPDAESTTQIDNKARIIQCGPLLVFKSR